MLGVSVLCGEMGEVRGGGSGKKGGGSCWCPGDLKGGVGWGGR